MNDDIDFYESSTSSGSQIDIPDQPNNKDEEDKYTKGKPHRITIIAKISHDKDTKSEN